MATNGNGNADKRLGAPSRSEGRARSYTSAPIPIEFAGPEHRFQRADLEIDDVTHDGVSYEGRIFFNNPDADKATPRVPEQGYAGSFHIFGHGGCLGDPGHCEVTPPTDSFDTRNPHPLTPATKRVEVTAALRRACAQGEAVVVTVVPVVNATNELTDDIDVFHCGSIHLLTYN
jgi:tyrosinase